MQKQLTVFSSIVGFYVDGHSNQHRSFCTNYLQFMDSPCATCIFLTGQWTYNVLWGCIRHTVSEAAKLVNVFRTVAYADFETAIHNTVTRVWLGCEVSFPLRTELVAENTIFGTQQAVWKERLWGKSVLEENIRTVAFTTGGSLRLLCVGIFIQSSERQASGIVLQLSARKLYWCRLHFSSACLVRKYCIITKDH